MSSLGLGDLGVSYLRTAVPPAVAAFLVWAGAQVGIEVPLIAQEHAGEVAFFVVWGGYYALFRVLELKWPKLGIFLGAPAAPVYDASPAEYEVHEITDPASGVVTERTSITRFPASKSG
jgi:hypothetical protein